MITTPRWISVTLFISVFLLALVLATALTVRQAAAGDDLLEAFEKTYTDIAAQVKKGKLKAEVGAKANDLKIALKKYLIKTDAQLEILQLDVLHGAGKNREASLEKMVAISAERERIKMGYLQRLQTLNQGKSGGKGDMLLLPVVPEQREAKLEKNEATPEKGLRVEEHESWSWKDIEIEIAPETTQEMINRD